MTLESKKKIFIIGFNKCGTSSFHIMFRKSGIASAHLKVPMEKESRAKHNIAKMLFTNFGLSRDPLYGMKSYDAFMDWSFCQNEMYLEGCRLYWYLWKYYPDSFFILNTRDVESWVQSRLNHPPIPSPIGPLRKRAVNAYHCDPEDLGDIWARQFTAHTVECRDFFQKKRARFLEFNIERDDISILRQFLLPHFDLSTEYWGVRNRTKA